MYTLAYKVSARLDLQQAMQVYGKAVVRYVQVYKNTCLYYTFPFPILWPQNVKKVRREYYIHITYLLHTK